MPKLRQAMLAAAAAIVNPLSQNKFSSNHKIIAGVALVFRPPTAAAD